MSAPQQADFVFVPLLDAGYGLTQVIEVREHRMLLGATAQRSTPGKAVAPLTAADLIAFVMVPTAPVISGLWILGGFEQIPKLDHRIDTKWAVKESFFSDIETEPAVFEAFLSACHGLYPWTGFGDLFGGMLHKDVDPATLPLR